jgi:hypothetical protein
MLYRNTMMSVYVNSKLNLRKHIFWIKLMAWLLLIPFKLNINKIPIKVGIIVKLYIDFPD